MTLLHRMLASALLLLATGVGYGCGVAIVAVPESLSGKATSALVQVADNHGHCRYIRVDDERIVLVTNKEVVETLPRLDGTNRWAGLSAGRHTVTAMYSEGKAGGPSFLDFKQASFDAMIGHQYFVDCLYERALSTWSLNVFDATGVSSITYDGWVSRSARVASTR